MKWLNAVNFKEDNPCSFVFIRGSYQMAKSKTADTLLSLDHGVCTMMKKTTTIVLASAAAAISLAGCYHPSGGLMSRTGGPQTYWSNEMMQKTITMVDLRTGEPFFGPLTIPPGKQLVIDFDAGDGDDPVNRPDLLYWEIMDQGKRIGKLHNAQSVPNASSRRIDVDLIRAVQYAPQPPNYDVLRTDEVNDRPAWWTPDGGPAPQERRSTMYDG